MGAAVMVCGDLDIVMVPSAVRFLVLDARIGEVHLVIEVRQLVLERPGADLFLGSIRMSVVVVTVAIPFMKPLLIIALELVIEDDSIDASAALAEALGCAFVRAIDLEVVFELSLAFEAVPERLTAALPAVTVPFEEAAAFLRATLSSYVMVEILGSSHRSDAPIAAVKRKRLAQIKPAKRRHTRGPRRAFSSALGCQRRAGLNCANAS